jgi:hypothetical protein
MGLHGKPNIGPFSKLRQDWSDVVWGIEDWV